GCPEPYFQRAATCHRSLISQRPPTETKCSRLKSQSYSPRSSLSSTRFGLDPSFEVWCFASLSDIYHNIHYAHYDEPEPPGCDRACRPDRSTAFRLRPPGSRAIPSSSALTPVALNGPQV